MDSIIITRKTVFLLIFITLAINIFFLIMGVLIGKDDVKKNILLASEANKKNQKDLIDLTRRQREVIEKLERQLDMFRANSSKGSPTQLDKLNSRLLVLEQTINPSKLEALTLARLRDKVMAVEQSQQAFEKRLLADVVRYEQSIEARLKISQESFKWLMLLIVPLFMNLLYSLWKDLRAAQQENDKSATENPLSGAKSPE